MQNKEVERDFFDKIANKGEYEAFDNNGYQRLIELFNQKIKTEQSIKILDLGCGTGAFTQYLTKNSRNIYGLNISFNCVRLARRILKINTLICADIEKLPFKDNSFDIIVYSGVLHHFDTLDDVLKEGHRVLKKNGWLFSYEPNGRNPIKWIFRSAHSPFFSRCDMTINERLIYSEEIKEKLFSSSFSYVEIHSVWGVTFNKFAFNRLLKTILPFYNLLERTFKKIDIFKYYGSFIISYARK